MKSRILTLAALTCLMLTVFCLDDLRASGREEIIGSVACRKDVEKHCKHVRPGGSRIRDCLMAAIKTISPECREMIERPVYQQQSRVCLADPRDACRQIPTHDPKYKECVKSEETRITEACREEIKAQKAEAAERMKPPPEEEKHGGHH